MVKNGSDYKKAVLDLLRKKKEKEQKQSDLDDIDEEDLDDLDEAENLFKLSGVLVKMRFLD